MKNLKAHTLYYVKTFVIPTSTNSTKLHKKCKKKEIHIENTQFTRTINLYCEKEANIIAIGAEFNLKPFNK